MGAGGKGYLSKLLANNAWVLMNQEGIRGQYTWFRRIGMLALDSTTI